MLGAINTEFNKAKNAAKEDRFIAEAAMDVEEILPGSEEEIDDLVDADSVPEDVYKKLDAALDKLIDDPNYDDTEVAEMVDGDDIDETELDDGALDAIVDEAVDGTAPSGQDGDVSVAEPGDPEEPVQDPPMENECGGSATPDEDQHGEGEVCPNCGQNPCACGGAENECNESTGSLAALRKIAEG